MLNIGCVMSAIYFVLENVARQTSHKKLLSLLYLADRESIVSCGWPITEDTPVIGKKGPELEGIRSLLENRCPEYQKAFAKVFETADSEISLKHPFNYDWLSKNDEAVLASVCKQFGQKSENWLMDFISELPECKDMHSFSWESILQTTRPAMVSVYKDLSTMLDTIPTQRSLDYDLSTWETF